MPLDEILSAIDEETSAGVAAVTADAERRRDEALEAAATRAETERRRLAASRDEAGAQAAARIVNRARLAADRAVRQAQEDLFQQAMSRVRERLTSVRASDGYDRLFEQLADEALDALPDATVVVVDPADADRAGTWAKRRGARLEVRTGAAGWGGVELRADDGRLVRNTLESRLEKAAGALRRLAVATIPELGRAGE